MRIPLEIPVDANNKPLQVPPAVSALASTYNASLGSAVNITLNVNTSYIEVSAFTAGVLLRWQTGASTTNFDAAVGPGATRAFAKPPTATVLSIIQQSATAAVAVVEK